MFDLFQQAIERFADTLRNNVRKLDFARVETDPFLNRSAMEQPSLFLPICTDFSIYGMIWTGHRRTKGQYACVLGDDNSTLTIRKGKQAQSVQCSDQISFRHQQQLFEVQKSYLRENNQ